jgi:hypothetical protein
MFDFFDEKPTKKDSTISTDRALTIGREIIEHIKSKYEVHDGVGGMVGALAICCAEAELKDDKTRIEALMTIHEDLDTCFRRLRRLLNKE